MPRGAGVETTTVGADAPHPLFGQLEIVFLLSSAQNTVVALIAMPVGLPAAA
jgi:hypothetical protein